MLSAYSVTVSTDNGSGTTAGTLSYGIKQANAVGSTITEIDFAIGTSGSAQSINLTGPLPTLTASNVYINGLSQGGSSNTVPLITLNGSGVGTISDGLLLQGFTDKVSGLIVGNFKGNGIEVAGTANTIGGAAAGAGNVIFGNGNDGILIDNGVTGTAVLGNTIGLNAGGATVGNSGNGIEVSNNLFAGGGNTIGGTVSADRNIISGNGNDGILIDSGGEYTVVLGNYIGTGGGGGSPIANSGNGIEVQGGFNTIGGTAGGAGNLVSGNLQDGILIGGGSVNYSSGFNSVQGNSIGTNPAGTAAVSNSGNGIEVLDGANMLGGTAAAARNIISGNLLDGILINSGANDNFVQNDFIGLNKSGAVLANSGNGVEILGQYNTVGGASASARNIISGNLLDGVLVDGTSSVSYTSVGLNTVEGNYIGTNTSGTAAAANSGNGVEVQNYQNTIGGSVSGAGNVISGNAQDGVVLDNGAEYTNVQGNNVGTNYNGSSALANGGNGVEDGSGFNNVIGGTTAKARNVISGNGGDGVLLDSVSTSNSYYSVYYSTVEGNYIGTNTAGTAKLGNSGNGVEVGESSAHIGVSNVAYRNIISGNLGDGVLIDSGTFGVRVQGNYIGTDYTGTAALGNNNGVEVAGYGNTIGGTTAAARNIISGNRNDGVLIDANGLPASVLAGSQIQGNYIGLNNSGGGAIANSVNGIEVAGNGNSIGGTSAGARNIISGNTGNGVLIDSGASGTAVQGNVIGLNASSAAVANGTWGVSIAGNNNTIGGSVAAAGNTIADNKTGGVLVSAGSGNTIRHNVITANGSSNKGPGISLSSGANNNLAAPSISSATLSGTTLTIKGTYTAPTANVPYVLDFFANPAGDPEGKLFLGSLTVTPTSTGSQSFTLAVTFTQSASYPFITATLTDNVGDTSQFSAGVTDPPAPSPGGGPGPMPPTPGKGPGWSPPTPGKGPGWNPPKGSPIL